MSRHMPHDDGSEQTPAAWQDDQAPAGWREGEPLDPDDLPWTVAPTSVPPDMTASEHYGTADATLQMPAVSRSPGIGTPPTAKAPCSGDVAGETSSAAVARPTADDATVLLPRDPSANRRGRRRRGDAAKRAVAHAIGIAKVSYNRAADAGDGKDEKKAGSQPQGKPPIAHSNSSGSVIAVFAILAVLVVSGIAAVYMTPKANTPPPPQPNPPAPRGLTPPASPTPTPSPSVSTATSPSVAASPRRSSVGPSQTVAGDVTTAKVDDCFVDLGTAENPNMQKVVCRAGSLKVIKRIDDTADMERCKQVATSTNFFSFEVNGDKPMKFVLCMRSI